MGLALCALLAASTLAAQSPNDEPIVVTRHRVTMGGRTLAYTARAGRIPIRDNEADDVHGQMFFVSYTLDRPSRSKPRPLTFAWNGGPGSNAALVHLVGFGPKLFDQPNPGTWLGETDLVFVDPIGTGYSRPTKAEYGKEFYSARGDAESVAEFIRVYRLRYGAGDAPLFLAGESYGVTRAAGVADALERRGTRVSGVVLLGLALPLGGGRMSAAMRAALALPSLHVAAFTNQKVPDQRRAVEQWASGDYARALARRSSLSAAERDSVARALARFTGLDPAALDRDSLGVPARQLARSLLAREGRVVGLYDSRMIGPLDTTLGPYDPTKDPSLQHLLDPVAVLRYLRNEVGYRSDLNYQGPWGGGYPPPTRFRGDWMSVKWDWRPDTTMPPQPLEHAMQTDSALRVFVACGIYDLVCDYYGNEWAATHLDEPLRRRVTVRSYEGGHAVYTDAPTRVQLAGDVTDFIRESLGPGRRPTPSTKRPMVLPDNQLGAGGLRYTVSAGVLPIMHQDDASVRANMFYVAYTRPRAGEPKRPITFAWNGGPGANSLLLHLHALGPLRLDSTRLAPNAESWLRFTDLVFVDPVGTGFSRPTDTTYARDFYGVLEDIAATREFIRAYRTHFDAWDAPVYLAGESYGTWRAAGVAEAMERAGERVAGIVLISGGIPIGPLASDEMRAALFLPTRVAAAAFHQRLPPALQRDTARLMKEAEDWGRTVYAPALARREALSPSERDTIVGRLARYTGLDTSVIDRKTLVVDRAFWLAHLAKDRRTLGRFDTRQSGSARDQPGRRQLVNQYLRDELGVRTDLVYQGLEEGWSASPAPRDPGDLWEWNQLPPGTPMVVRNTDGPPGGPPPWVQRAFALDPRMKVFVGAGVYDSLNSCPLIAYQVSLLAPALRARITLGCYVGGHMMYEDRDARLALQRDVERFYRVP